VTGLQIDSHKTLMLFSGRSFPELADEVAKELACDVSPVKLYDFANGETYCRFEESVRGCDAFLIQSHHSRVNDWVVEQLIMCDALKRASAKRITVVVPFYPYSRQDKKTLAREPISAKLMADLFRTAGANRIIAIDLHTPQIQGYFDAPLDHLTALPLLSDYLAEKLDLSHVTIVSPDTGRVRTAEKYTDRLGKSVNLAFVHKRRDAEVPNEAKTFDVVGQVEGRTCVIVDDMIDTAGTITKAADALLDRGATEVLCASRTARSARSS
jgi:ribose-phosphate pyrophosphokinase